MNKTVLDLLEKFIKGVVGEILSKNGLISQYPEKFIKEKKEAIEELTNLK